MPAPYHAEIESVIIDMAECCTRDYQSLVDWDVVHESLAEAKVAVDRAVATWAVCLWLCAQPSNAECDARVLAHAYTHDSRPPQAIVDRALAYRAGRRR